MKTKLIKGLSVVLTALFFGTMTYIPLENSGVTLVIIGYVMILNLLCQWRDLATVSFVLEAFVLGVLWEKMLSFDTSTVIDQFDLLSAESIGTSRELVGSGSIIFALALMFTVLNRLTFGNYLGWWRGFFTKTALPSSILIVFSITGCIRNAKADHKVEKMIEYAVEMQPDVQPEPIELKSEVIKPVVNKKTIGKMTYADILREVPEDLQQIKIFEDAPLALGKKKVSILNEDKLKPGVMQVGYCITKAEIYEAIRLGFLPKGSTLPKRMTKEQSDQWFAKITVPTYLAQVYEVLSPKVKLTAKQTAGLMSFCHNLGKGNLKLLIAQPGRLNDGNMEKTLTMIPKYANANGVPIRGLTSRREFEKNCVANK